MKDGKMLFATILVISAFLGAVGQLLFKLGLSSSLGMLVAFIAAGFIAYVISTVLYFYILGRSHLSWAYGFVGFSYIFTELLAYYVLAEHVDADKWIGVLVIVAGTVLIGLS